MVNYAYLKTLRKAKPEWDKAARLMEIPIPSVDCNDCRFDTPESVAPPTPDYKYPYCLREGADVHRGVKKDCCAYEPLPNLKAVTPADVELRRLQSKLAIIKGSQ